MKKTVLITGGARGIGAAITKAFAEKGFNVVINYNVSKRRAETLAEEIGGGALAVRADVSVREDVFNMAGLAIKKFGRIDVLINNAGIAGQALFNDITEEMWDSVFNVNVKGAFNCIQAVLPDMISEKRGRIINISSIWGISGASCETHYSASKAALIGLTKSLAKELGPSGITVNCIAPGVIGTDMNAGLSSADIEDLRERTALMRIGAPADVASLALFLASEEASFITGQVIASDGGFL